MPSAFSFSLQLALQIYLLGTHTASAFQCRISHLGFKSVSKLSAVNPIVSSDVRLKKDLLLSLRLEFSRAVEIIVNAPLQRKIVALAHPLAILLLYLLLSSKFMRNFGEAASRSFTSFTSSISSSIKKFQKESILATSLSRAKIQDQSSEAIGTVESGSVMAAISPVAATVKSTIVASADTNLVASAITTTTYSAPVKKEIISPSAAIISKIADIEAQEKAYMKAQKLKRETAMKASNAKAQAFEAEQIRVERIAKASREADEFRIKHDIEFRRWDKEQNGADSDILRLEQEVERATQEILNEKLAAQALQILTEKLAAEELQKKAILSIHVEDAISRAAMEQEMDRLAVKAAVDKAVKDAEAAYALRIKEKAALLKVTSVSSSQKYS